MSMAKRALPLLALIFLGLFTMLFSHHWTGSYAAPPLQAASLTIVGPDRMPNPVVNEGAQLMLSLVDGAGNAVSGNITFESGSPEIASVDAQSGMVTGVQRGFATVTARMGGMSVTTFIVVTRVGGDNGRSPRELSQTKRDMGGAFYISDPVNHTIMTKRSKNSPVTVFAGIENRPGLMNVNRRDALFNGPTAIAVDNSAQGGIYVADSLNHSIRKIGFNDKVETVVGNGTRGTNLNEITRFDQAQLSAPLGVAVDDGGNLFVADTENHCIYFLDMAKRQMRLLAGDPGRSGRADGRGRAARFFNPASITIAPNNLAITVADTGNGVARIITRDGEVTTVGPLSRLTGADRARLAPQAEGDAFIFDQPSSVSFDATGNLYVVDRRGVQVVTLAAENPQLVKLAQAGSFGQAVSVEVRGTETFVLDARARSEQESLKVVTVGAPEIIEISNPVVRQEGGGMVTIRGRNFAPESLVVIGDVLLDVKDYEVISATEIRFNVPPQNSSGSKVLSVRTRGGLAQKELMIVAKPLNELRDGEITTVAGGIPFIGDGGAAARAAINEPGGLAIDARGNLIFADIFDNRIRSVDSDSAIIVTVAGTGLPASDGGPDGRDALTVNLTNPIDVAIDSQGNIYTNDFSTILRFDAFTNITTTAVAPGDNDSLGAFALDEKDNIYLADLNCNCIRRFDPVTGARTVIAGSNQAGFGGDGGQASAALLSEPRDIDFDGNGNLFIADRQNHRIRRVDLTTGIITTVAGNGLQGFDGDGGMATNARLNAPQGIALDSDGNLFIADTDNHRIRRVDALTGIITTVAGSNSQGGFDGDGGPAVAARLFSPVKVAVDGAGDIYISDRDNNIVRRVFANENPTLAIIESYVSDGALEVRVENIPALQARLLMPEDIDFDLAGNLLIADTEAGRLRRVNRTSQLIETIAGLRNVRDGNGDGGPAIDAFFIYISNLAVERDGDIIVLDDMANLVRRIVAASAIVLPVAGGGDSDENNIPAIQTKFFIPDDIAVDMQGNIYIAEPFSHRVRRIDRASGLISIYAGGNGMGAAGDNGPALSAQLNAPSALAFDNQGNLYIADAGNFKIRRIDAATRVITTFAGSGEQDSDGTGRDGGSALNATFSSRIAGMVFDRAGNLYLSDTFLNRVRRIDTNGMIDRIAGTGGNGGLSGDGGPAINAQLREPSGLAIDSAGNLYIADKVNDRIRVIKGAANGGGGVATVTIDNAAFNKPVLAINGRGFGSSGATVLVNGNNVSAFIANQTDTLINLRGNKKKLQIKKGENQVVVTVNGVSSRPFTFIF